MAKVNTGTITVAGDGTWSSNAMTLPAGSNRLYLRQNGTQLLYRDFTVTVGADVVQSVVGSGETNNTTPVTTSSLTTGATASKLLVCAMTAANGNSGGFDQLPTTSPSLSSSPSLTWTRVVFPSDVDLYPASGGGGSAMWWYATPATNTAYTVTYNNSVTTTYTKYVVLMEVTGAASIAAIGSGSSTTATASTASVTPTATGSLILTGTFANGATAPSSYSGTVVRSDAATFADQSMWVIKQTSTGTSGITTGQTAGTNYAHNTTAVEIKSEAVNPNLLGTYWDATDIATPLAGTSWSWVNQGTFAVTPSYAAGPSGAYAGSAGRIYGPAGEYPSIRLDNLYLTASTQYTFSMYVAAASSGSVPNSKLRYNVDSSGGDGTPLAATDWPTGVTTTWSRVSFTFTTGTSGGANLGLAIVNVSTGALDLLTWGWKLELGATATGTPSVLNG